MQKRQSIRGAAARERIIDVARELFAEKGLDGVTMDEVARAASVARATVFNHFDSKHGLVDAITAGVLVAYVSMLDQALQDRKANCEEQVRALCIQMGQGIEPDRRFYRAVFREIAKLTLGIDEGGMAYAARQAGTNRIEQLVTRWQAKRQASVDFEARDLAQLFDSIIFGTITHWLYEEDDRSLVDQMSNTAELFLKTLSTAPNRNNFREVSS